MEVCIKCSRKCLLRKKCTESPQISSFFKVMLGNKFSERLFLPPKFVRTHILHVGRKMILQDSRRQRWSVVLSFIDGGLAFDKGWNMFSITHGIEEGDFVVFHYVMESSSQFTVQIFDKTGCEKLSVENNKKVKTSRDASNLYSAYDSFCKTPPEKHPSDHRSLSEENDYIFKRRDESEDDVRMSSPMEERYPSQENIARGLTREPVRDFMDEMSFMVDRNMNISKEDVARMSTPVEEPDPSHENIARGLARETVNDFMDDVSFMLDRNMNFCKEDVNEDLFDLSMFELPEEKTVAKEVVEMEGPSVDAKKCHVDEEYIFSNNIGLMTENKELYPLAMEHASVPENSPDTEIAPSPSMAQKPVAKSLKSEILAPSVGPVAALDREPFPSVPELGEIVPAIEDPSLSLLKGVEVGPVAALDREPFPSVPELGEIVPAIEDPSLSLLKGYGTRSRTRTLTTTLCPMPTTQSSQKAGTPTGRPRGRPRGVKQERRIVLKEEVLIEEPEPLKIIFATVSSITCSVQADKDYFLLSEPLPLKPGRLVKREKKVVYLYDPVGRTWPVRYHQSHDSNVLASGWDVFRKANDIQMGNTCTFSLADVYKPTFSVTIHSLLCLN